MRITPAAHRLLLVTTVLACEESATGGGGGDDVGNVPGTEVFQADGVSTDGATPTDAVTGGDVNIGCDFDLNPSAGEPGSPCTSDADCVAGLCVTTPWGQVCTATCTDCCPTGFSCEEVSAAAATRLCLPVHGTLCRPCRADADCAGAGANTLCVDYGDEGRFCGAPCAGSADCPTGYECASQDGTDTTGVQQCVRASGLCGCSLEAVDSSAETDCAVTNSSGTCTGVRKCGAGGLEACSAATPAAESCNGADDDCDGETDEEVPATPCVPAGGVCAGAEVCTGGELVCEALPKGDETCNGQDDDCNGTIDDGFPNLDGDSLADCVDGDIDGDGAPNDKDCSPNDAAVSPSAVEVCNGQDDDCADGVDNGCDDDKDTFCDSSMGVTEGASCTPGDCNDELGAVSPDAAESCNGQDDDCDGNVDADLAQPCDDKNACTLDSCAGEAGCTASAVLDGTDCGQGLWCVNSSCSAKPSCGDGLLNQPSEVCDDGDTDDTNGCDSACRVAAGYTCSDQPSDCSTDCGDGVVAGTEQCDSAGDTDGCTDCKIAPGFACAGAPSVCAATCGDGVLAGAETCDDENSDPADGCDACQVVPGWSCDPLTGTCTTGCGDKVIAGPEMCDDAGLVDGDGCSASCVLETGFTCSGQPSVCTTQCGDGIPAGAEQCDDGKTEAGDGCSANCAIEPGFDCTTGICASKCGDGIKAQGEECDDSNTSGNDGCSATCAVEPGWSCAGNPSLCLSNCGDNLVVGAEQCDDGLKEPGDGCGATCALEAGWSCSGAPSVCVTGCGDGTKAGAETCDDKNNVDGDGCSAICKTEPGFSCSGTPSLCKTACGDGIRAGAEECDDGDTTGGNGCSGNCIVEPGFTCSGSPNICVTQCGDGKIAATEACDDGGQADEDGCSAACQVESGWTCVGQPSSCGAECGDGVIAGNEECDDEGSSAGDGCSATCKFEFGWDCSGQPSECQTHCGDGEVAGLEGCDDGENANADGCSASCTVEPGFSCSGNPSECATGCGDSITAGAEECDDGDLLPGDGCDGQCKREPGWSCGATGCSTQCGDGQPAGAEQCDDGETESGDGCSSNCTFEPGFACSGTPSVCTTTCGDAIKAGAEACDDGGTGVDDGCSATCTVDDGYSCVGSPSACNPTCGDSRVVGNETCDDANSKPGDGCTSCQADIGWECSGAPSVCAPDCGDGKIAGNEACDDGDELSGNGCSASCTVEVGFYCTIPGEACATDCGDKIVAGAEACDDGGELANDGCSATCGVEIGWQCAGSPSSCNPICGDALKIAGKETCDDGNPHSGDGCSEVCKVEFGYACTGTPSVCTATCGDGQRAAVEACDDGDEDPGDGCAANCTVEFGYSCTGNLPSECTSTCGDGQKSANENCDDGNDDSNDGCTGCLGDPGYECTGTEPSVCTADCGDGIKVPAEACDDGDTEPGDGCDALCTQETGWSCAGNAPTVCVAECGDGLIAEGAEACDDHQSTPADGDGCSATCQVEAGYACAGTPSVCATVCGDGIIAGAENCEDGNIEPNDGCSEACVSALGWSCPTIGQACITDCSDGIVAGAETCDDGNETDGDCCSATCAKEPGCEAEPNGTCATANTVVLPGEIKGYFPTTSDADYFTFTLTAISNLHVQVFDAGGSAGGTCADPVDTITTIYKVAGGSGEANGGAPTCTQIATDDAYTPSDPANCEDMTPDAFSTLRQLAPGTYSVQVRPYFQSTTPYLYTVLIETTSTCGNGTAETFEQCDGGVNCDVDCTFLPFCGDGILDEGEECDDAGNAPSDGCDADCQLEAGYAGEVEPNDTCATAVALPALPVTALGHFTATTDDDYYAFTLTAASDVSVRTYDGTGTGCASPVDTIVTVQNADCTTTLLDAIDWYSFANGSNCENLTPTNYAALRQLAPGTYKIKAEAYGGAPWSYRLEVKTLSTCGNGIVEGYEKCDGSATCNPDCTKPPGCGDGVLQEGEACDDGNEATGDGCFGCALEPGYFADTEPNDTCPGAAQTITLPATILGTFPANTDRDSFSFTLTAPADLHIQTFDSSGTACAAPVDTVVNLFKENCTTTQMSQKDSIGCENVSAATETNLRQVPAGTYRLRVHPYADAPYGYVAKIKALTTCGNQVKEGFEECDNGTAACDANCKIVPTCGDGLLNGTEQCDDANPNSGDGCSGACIWETIPEPSGANNTKSDADARATEGTLITGSVRYSGAITPAADLDTLKMTVATDRAIRMEVFDSTGSGCSSIAASKLTVFKADGVTTQLMNDGNSTSDSAGGISTCAGLVGFFPAGDYYVRVQASSSTATIAAYQLEVAFLENKLDEVEPNDTAATATVITAGATTTNAYIHGDHTPGSELDHYSISVPAGRSLRIETIEGLGGAPCSPTSSTSPDPFITVLKPDGSSLLTDDDDGRGYCSLIDGTGSATQARDANARALPAGTYTIQVKASSFAATTAAQFKYRLAVTIR